MRKVIKNVVKIAVATVSALMLAALMLPLVVSLLASIPAVQNFAVRRVVSALSEKLGTRVAIERIDIKLINRVEVRGFYVEDFHGDTLLYVPKLTAPIVELGLAGGAGRTGRQLTFGRVKLTGAEMWLRRDSLGTINIREVVTAIRGGHPPDPDSRFRMRIMGIEADSLTFGLLRGDRPLRAGGIDFSRFVIRDTRIDIDRFSIAGDTVRIGIRSLSFDERSGLHMDNLSAHDLVISRGSVALSDVGIRSGSTNLDVPAIRLESSRREWRDFRNFNDSVSLGVTMRSSRLSTDFLRFFLPAAADWGLVFDDLSLHTDGVLAALSGSVGNARTLGTEFSLDFASTGAPDLGNLRLDADVTSLSTSGGDIDSLLCGITGKGLPAGILEPLERMGALGFTGKFGGSMAAGFDAQGTLTSDAGAVDLAATVATGRGAAGITGVAGVAGSALDGRVSTPGFDLGRALGADGLGMVSGEFAARGIIGGKEQEGQRRRIEGEADGRIAGLEFRDYTYTGITLDGKFDGETLVAKVLAHDPALDFDFSGVFDLWGGSPGAFQGAFSGELDLRKADLAATNLDRKNSVSTLSAHLAVQVTGATPDDATGTVELTDGHYVSGYGSVETSLATVTASHDAAGKHIALRSEFADADFRSCSPYRETFRYLAGFLRENIPLLGAGEREQPLPPDEADPGTEENLSKFELKIKDIERLLDALSPGTGVARGSEASLTFDPHTGDFSLSATSKFIESGGILATDIELNTGNTADSLTLHLASSDVYSGTMHIPGFELHGAVRGREVGVSFDGETWLSATGVISHEAADTLHIRLNGFDVSPLGRLLGRRGLEVGGRATGYIDVISTLRNPKMNAGIDLYSLSLGGMRAAPLRFTSFWDRPAERIRFQVLNRATDTGVLHGSLSPAGGEIDAVAAIDSLDMSLLDPMLGGVLENTRGKANVRLTLGGTFKNPRLDGSIDIPRLETTVGYTRAAYTLTEGELRIVNSVLTLPRTLVHDRFGGTADLSMKVDMTNFRDVGVEIDAVPRGLLAFDTGAGDSDAFYGRVFATGSMGIRAGRMGTRMDISARTDAGTRVHLPLGASSNISWADFVVFVDPSRVLDTTDVLERKKLAYERRLQGGQRARRKPLDMNLNVTVTRDAEVHLLIDPNLGDGITATGEGVIGLGINPATNLFTMTGNYVISNGRFELSMMDVFNKDFTITPGSTLRWSGAADDAMLDVEASYRVRTSLAPLLGEVSGLVPGRASVPVDCILQVKGRLSEPEITFDIALPSADPDARLVAQNTMNTQELKSMQFLSLLMTGSFARDNSIAGQGANTGALASGAVGFDILTNTLGNFLSSEDYDIYFRYRPEDNFMTNQFDVGLSTGFVNDRLLLEIEGNYVDDRAATSVGTSNASNLAGDVSLTWVIDRAGNLRLKVFSQTIDRLNETQGLQESGLGIYWKKDFDRFRDIFVRKNSKFAPDSVIIETPRRKKQLKTE